MVETNVNVPTWKQKLAAELRRDTRKTVILGVLLVAAGAVAGRLIVRELTPADARAGVRTDGQGRRSSQAALSTSVTAHNPGGQSEAGPVRPASYVQQLNRSITRDIFRPNPDFFPPELVKPPKVVTTSTVNGNKEIEAQRKAVRAQARALILQSTVVSDKPTAIINGRVLRVGEWVNGFEVVQITSRTCVLEKKGVKVVLAMKS